MTTNRRLLDEVFGEDSNGSSPEERARTSDRVFVRSQHQLTILGDGATGRRLNAVEALGTFGWQTLKALADRPAVSLIEDSKEPYQAILNRLDALNLDFHTTAKKAGWNENIVKLFEGRRQVPFKFLERMAQSLALDERVLGRPGAMADDALGVRLRELRGGDAVHFTQAVVLGLAEAAWVVGKQIELGDAVRAIPPDHLRGLGFQPDPSYGNYQNPAWKVGYELAHKTRQLLSLSEREPIESLKELIEGRLKIPVIQLELPSKFAGATIANDNNRGIVVNLEGQNHNVWVRRMTLAHELGHLLWDPNNRLRNLIVDQYTDVINSYQKEARDYVEMRANGFAIEFLAPQRALIDVLDDTDDDAEGLRTVMSRYGISKTAAVYHISNAYHGVKDFSSVAHAVNLEPEDDWNARELLAASFFNPPSVPTSRRGNFAGYVTMAADQKLISKDSAAALLGCEPGEIDAAFRSIRSLILEG